MCKLGTRKAVQFYGATSLLQVPQTSSPKLASSSPLQQQQQSYGGSSMQVGGGTSSFPFSPKDEVCQRLMRNFFLDAYQHNMCIYREYFLRDYAASGGPYYSDALMFSICAIGSLISPDPELRQLASTFAAEAGSIVFESLESPDLTTLQSLILLGHLEIGQGRSSKGWLFCGMAFRLTHEMGLHLDPTNWSTNNSESESSVDREILRRVYWAVFLIDKQLSLYFGRPPALYPQEADVRNTIRIPYPPEWEDLLDSYISKGTSATAFEDGVRLVGCFIHQVELAKISHTLIVDVFENRHRQSDTTAAATTAHQVHTSLVRWLALLPQKLHWNQWTVGQVPPYVLHLHMLFHTCMIILHRPPRQHWDDEAVAKGEDVEICFQSLAAVLRLLKTYQRYYRFQVLPLDFVQTLSAAAEVVMLKRYVEKSAWTDKDIAKPMTQILEAMEAVQEVYPCIREIHRSLIASTQSEPIVSGPGAQEMDSLDLDLMDMLQSGAGPFPHWLADEGTPSGTVDLGFLVTDETLNDLPPWDVGSEAELYG